VKLSVVGPGKSGIWRRERIRMTEQELDDVAFLTGSLTSLRYQTSISKMMFSLRTAIIKIES
jgi:hypothetical protein